MLSADYYRAQAEICLRMSQMSTDPVLTDRLNLLAAEFLAAADDPRPETEFHASAASESGNTDSLDCD